MAQKKAFTLLEVLVVIAIIVIIAGLSVNDFSFIERIQKRPPKVVLLEAIKNARLMALTAGEELSLYYDKKKADLVLRRSFDGSQIESRNLFSLSPEDKKAAEEKAMQRGEIFELPEASVVFYPIYPDLFNYTRSESDGKETLVRLRFAPDSSMTPALIELKVGDNQAISFELDPLSGSIMKKENANKELTQ